jgi:predicted O-linked N-acetylglucosamine transferase (SPINDLY family)
LSYGGYPNTTGLEVIGYRLTDAVADPPGQTEAFHTERLVRLPRTNWCYAALPGYPEVSVRRGAPRFSA